MKQTRSVAILLVLERNYIASIMRDVCAPVVRPPIVCRIHGRKTEPDLETCTTLRSIRLPFRLDL